MEMELVQKWAHLRFNIFKYWTKENTACIYFVKCLFFFKLEGLLGSKSNAIYYKTIISPLQSFLGWRILEQPNEESGFSACVHRLLCWKHPCAWLQPGWVSSLSLKTWLSLVPQFLLVQPFSCFPNKKQIKKKIKGFFKLWNNLPLLS